jgi:hypothetical protein
LGFHFDANSPFHSALQSALSKSSLDRFPLGIAAGNLRDESLLFTKPTNVVAEFRCLTDRPLAPSWAFDLMKTKHFLPAFVLKTFEKFKKQTGNQNFTQLLDSRQSHFCSF